MKEGKEKKKEKAKTKRTSAGFSGSRVLWSSTVV